MGISGSDLAPKQARANVARFGASRFGDFYPSSVVSVNSVDVSRRVRLESVRITDQANDLPNTATFTLREGTAPVAGNACFISLGGGGTARLFTGNIIRVTQRQVRTGQVIEYACEAMDYTWLLDRRLVTWTWVNTRGDDIIKGLFALFVTGSFTLNHLALGLNSIPEFVIVNERPSAVLTRLGQLLGYQWYIDDLQDLHFFVTQTGGTAIKDLDTINFNFWDLEAVGDLSQVRTRVYIEGRSTTCPIQIESNTTAMEAITSGTIYLPVEDSSMFSASGGTFRMAGQRLTYTTIDVGAGRNATGTYLTANAAVGATSLTVNDTAPIGNVATNWIKVGDQYCFFSGVLNPNILSLPASGFGSLLTRADIGTQVTPMPMVGGIAPSQFLVRPVRAQEPLVAYIQDDDTVAQTAIGTLEGGDGIHESVVLLPNATGTAATDRSNADLEDFNETLVTLRYKTREMATKSGHSVSINLGSLFGTYVIQEVIISGFDSMGPRAGHSKTKFPIREVLASPVKLSSFLEHLTSGEDTA